MQSAAVPAVPGLRTGYWYPGRGGAVSPRYTATARRIFRRFPVDTTPVLSCCYPVSGCQTHRSPSLAAATVHVRGASITSHRIFFAVLIVYTLPMHIILSGTVHSLRVQSIPHRIISRRSDPGNRDPALFFPVWTVIHSSDHQQNIGFITMPSYQGVRNDWQEYTG